MLLLRFVPTPGRVLAVRLLVPFNCTDFFGSFPLWLLCDLGLSLGNFPGQLKLATKQVAPNVAGMLDGFTDSHLWEAGF